MIRMSFQAPSNHSATLAAGQGGEKTTGSRKNQQEQKTPDHLEQRNKVGAML